jgi:multidrug efflux pump subunit AcrA (membrane-fusion protein)
VRIGAVATAAGALCAALTAVACGGTGTAAPPAENRPVSSVGVAAVAGVDEPVVVEATGSFQPDESSDVAPQSSGRVTSTPVDVGQHVAGGTVLIRIQDLDAKLRLDEMQATVARAEANLKLAQSQNALAQTTAQRTAALLKGGLVPQTVADEARTQA